MSYQEHKDLLIVKPRSAKGDEVFIVWDTSSSIIVIVIVIVIVGQGVRCIRMGETRTAEHEANGSKKNHLQGAVLIGFEISTFVRDGSCTNIPDTFKAHFHTATHKQHQPRHGRVYKYTL